jgi:hypothetical protein
VCLLQLMFQVRLPLSFPLRLLPDRPFSGPALCADFVLGSLGISVMQPLWGKSLNWRGGQPRFNSLGGDRESAWLSSASKGRSDLYAPLGRFPTRGCVRVHLTIRYKAGFRLRGGRERTTSA